LCLYRWYSRVLKKFKMQAANLMTLLNGYLGGTALFSCAGNRLGLAAVLIFLAALFDMFDGKLARRLKVESEFGKQLDSLCDAVSFGAAPAVLMNAALFHLYGFFGVLFSCIYLLCGVIRLACFNTAAQNGYFYGLPITAAGVLLAAAVYAIPYIPPYCFFFWILLLSVLMVTPFKMKKI